jgi:hypothetical protein
MFHMGKIMRSIDLAARSEKAMPRRIKGSQSAYLEGI